MTIQLWHIIVTATLEVRQLLDSAVPLKDRAGAAVPAASLSATVRNRLRAEIMAKLSQLKTNMRTYLSEKEAGMVLLPLVIHIDELVMVRLARDEQSPWPLLQRELFEIRNGGEVFFDFIHERTELSDSPPILFQVLYFCLSDGFRGKYDSEPARIEQCKLTLIEKMRMPSVPAPGRKRRGKDQSNADAAVILPPAQARWFYLTALLLLGISLGLTVLFTNL